MSFHVSPQIEGTVTSALPDILPVPFAAAPVAPLPAADTLSVRLGHIDLVLAISAASALPAAGLPLVEQQPTRDGTLHLRVAGNQIPTSFRLATGPVPAGTDDPVIRRMSLALEAAEHRADEYGDVYADALRLAIVTRALTMRPAGDPLEAPVVEPVPAPRRPKSGLPKWRLKKVVAYIDDNLSESVSLAGMADAAGLSRMHFAAQFRVTTGLRPHEFLLRRRIEKAQAMMIETRETLVAVALEVGFQTQAHFTTVFRRFVGDTPHQWRSAQRGRN
ncbi:helix-turn-helix transcriptional regulator [Ancylobacter sonchi]|uniref:helix-turn-helix domain-containing protein n=1 Tax=Ancylobacter sonchi TaxID=1937790 RepID=UPI001BD3DAC1|nr:AraC family transcriptional regulator [Ancylobacter sonchi]MBS7532867.1 helix-turn-helix transcriptional regulator [Ancylobacter sonchi]